MQNSINNAKIVTPQICTVSRKRSSAYVFIAV